MTCTQCGRSSASVSGRCAACGALLDSGAGDQTVVSPPLAPDLGQTGHPAGPPAPLDPDATGFAPPRATVADADATVVGSRPGPLSEDPGATRLGVAPLAAAADPDATMLGGATPPQVSSAAQTILRFQLKRVTPKAQTDYMTCTQCGRSTALVSGRCAACGALLDSGSGDLTVVSPPVSPDRGQAGPPAGPSAPLDSDAQRIRASASHSG